MPDTLAQTVRAKYPGAYDDLSDQQLEAAVAKKYPGQYDDLPKTGTGSERTRTDTNMLGVDHVKLQQSIANWASTLSPRWQKPAAMLATFPADVLASFAEMFSAPEAVAGAPGASKATGAVVEGTANAARGAVAGTANVVRKTAAIADALGPDVVGMASPRAGNALRTVQKIRDRVLTREAPAAAPVETAPPATSPGASPSAAPPPPVPSPVAAAATAEAEAAQQMVDQLGYSPSEAAQAVKWMKQRMPSELIWKRIQDARKLQQTGPFAKLPSNAEVDASVADRNATGRWPQDK